MTAHRREDLDATVGRLFAAAEAADWATFASLFRSDAVMAQNVGTEQPVAEAVVGLRQLLAGGTTVRYQNVRRFIADDAVTELHNAIFTKPDGAEVTIDICVVIQFDGDGLIVRTDEYLDSRAAVVLLS